LNSDAGPPVRVRPVRAALTAQVEAVEDLTPRLRRIVFGGAGLAEFATSEFTDQYVKLQFRREDAADVRPKVRTYTVREWDVERGLMTIDFVIHGDEGIAGPWAMAAAPGDRLDLRGPGGGYAPGQAADWHLMAGDASVIPAISASLPLVPAGADVHVFVQIRGPEDEIDLTSPGELRMHWLHGEADDGVAEAIAALDFPPGNVQVFLHGEATSVRLARRHLVVGRGVPVEALSASGYWKRKLTDEAWRDAKPQWIREVDEEAANV